MTHRYIKLLEVSFQVRKLAPYAVNPTTRLVKSPKLYWNDSGLAAHLAGFSDANELRNDPRCGAYLENLLLCELDAWRECEASRPEIYYWRTAADVEVDFVVEQKRRLLPIEAKASSRVRAADARGLERFLDTHAQARWGLLVHAGADLYRLSPRVVVAPLALLLV